MLKLNKDEVIIIHCELFPYVPPIFEWVLFKLNKNIYVDYDDAIFHNYDLSDNLAHLSTERLEIVCIISSN